MREHQSSGHWAPHPGGPASESQCPHLPVGKISFKPRSLCQKQNAKAGAGSPAFAWQTLLLLRQPRGSVPQMVPFSQAGFPAAYSFGNGGFPDSGEEEKTGQDCSHQYPGSRKDVAIISESELLHMYSLIICQQTIRI